jgi:histidine ammonia-lyase
MLFKPEFTGLAPFLAAGSTGSSGLMITEYVVQDVLADLRVSVAPVSGGSVSISLGMEEHASFASQGARLLREVSAMAPTIIAIEAVAAVRALRMAPARLRTDPARAAYDFLARELDAEQTDRPLGDDIERASSLLPGLRQFVGDGL